MKIVKYKWKILYLLDFICYVLTYPWLAMLSLFLSCFWSTTEEMKDFKSKSIKILLFAPILGFIEIVTFPLAFFGYVAWFIISNGKFLKNLKL